MNRNGTVLCGIAVLVLSFAVCPRLSRADDWLPIPPEDLAMKDNPKEPGADAMILYRQVTIDARHAYDGDSVEEYIRMKVFTQTGTKAGHVEIGFNGTYDDVSYAAGRTIRPDGSIVNFDGQVLATTAAKAAGFKNMVKSFTLPDVQPGCIIEFRYRIEGKRLHIIHDEQWNVSTLWFTREAHFKFYPSTAQGMPQPFYRPYGLPAGAEMKEQVDHAFVMDLQNIPPIVMEPLMLPERVIAGRVDFHYENTDFPSVEPVPSYWSHRGKKWSGELDHFVDKKGALSQELAKIVGPGDSTETKLRKIYARAQQIRNLGEEDYKMEQEKKEENIKPNSNVEDVLSRGYGTARDINYLFIGLVRAAGFEATEIRLAPRNVDFFDPQQEDDYQLRTAVAWVQADQHQYFLDPSSRAYPFGLLPWYKTNASGVKLNDRGGEGVTTSRPLSSEATIVRHADLAVSSDGSANGKLQIDFTGQEGALLREENHKEDETGRTKILEEKIKAWLPVDSTFEITKIANWENVDQGVHVEGNLKIPSFATGAQKRMLMPLEIFQPSQLESFVSEKRVNSIYFHYPYEEMDDLRFHPPSGYAAAGLPPERKINPGPVSYDISAAQDGNGVEVKRHLVVSELRLSKDAYPALRQFFGSMRTNDNAQVVLQDSQSAANQ